MADMRAHVIRERLVSHDFFFLWIKQGIPKNVPARKSGNRLSPKQEYPTTMLTRIHASIKRHCTVSRSAKFGVPPPLSAAAMRRTSRHRVQSPKADMQNACCRQFTNPHKLPCQPVCNPNTKAAAMGQCWATSSQQFPGGAGLRRHQKNMQQAQASLIPLPGQCTSWT